MSSRLWRPPKSLHHPPSRPSSSSPLSRLWARTHVSAGVSAAGPRFGPPRWSWAAVEQGPQLGAPVPGGQNAAHMTLEPATSLGAALGTCTPPLPSSPPLPGPLELQGQRRDSVGEQLWACDPWGAVGRWTLSYESSGAECSMTWRVWSLC